MALVFPVVPKHQSNVHWKLQRRYEAIRKLRSLVNFYGGDVGNPGATFQQALKKFLSG